MLESSKDSVDANSSIYSFGIPPQLKRQLEEKALETMGENKASYMMKDAIGKVPASDQKVNKQSHKTNSYHDAHARYRRSRTSRRAWATLSVAVSRTRSAKW